MVASIPALQINKDDFGAVLSNKIGLLKYLQKILHRVWKAWTH
jgi:hypothetical protein